MNAPISLLNSRDVFTVADLQAILYIGRSRAYELVRTGKIESFRIGRDIRITREKILEFIDKNRILLENYGKMCYTNDSVMVG